MISVTHMCQLQEPPFEMDIVVSSDIEAFIEAFAPKPKETKKPKKKTPATGMEVIEMLADAPSTQINPEELRPQEIVNETLPSYEDMIDDLFGPSSMETQPDLDMPANLEQVVWQEYMMDASKPLHTNFLLPDQGQALSYSCPVFFGRVYEKGIVVEVLCNEIHPRI